MAVPGTIRFSYSIDGREPQPGEIQALNRESGRYENSVQATIKHDSGGYYVEVKIIGQPDGSMITPQQITFSGVVPTWSSWEEGVYSNTWSMESARESSASGTLTIICDFIGNPVTFSVIPRVNDKTLGSTSPSSSVQYRGRAGTTFSGSLTAVEKSGAKFVRWDKDGRQYATTKQISYTVTLTTASYSSVVFTAVFVRTRGLILYLPSNNRIVYNENNMIEYHE